MTKQVNLFKAGLLPGYGSFQLPMFAGVTALAIVAGLAWVGMAQYERQQLLVEEAQWNESVSEIMLSLAAFQEQHPNINNESALQQTNETLTKQLEFTRETYSGLATEVENSIEGFHAPLMQLSEYDLNGLWLNQINLKDGKRYFNLQGYTRDPELIPRYIEQLGKSSFSGITIKQLTVSREENQKNLWRFNLSNNQATASAGGF